MKTYTVIKREGELLGPVDWSYDFLSHFDSYCVPDAAKKEMCQKAMDRLKLLADNPADYKATNDGGWPRMWYHDVIAVGMYDGWPFWRPVPSVCLHGTLGAEWHHFACITDILKKEPSPTATPGGRSE